MIVNNKVGKMAEPGKRAQQKERTRQAIIDAAFGQLGPEHGLSSLSLREVAREAGIAPTSFYRHFSDMEELGLTLVDEGGLTLRQLMRQARVRIASGGSVILTSVQIFMEFIDNKPNIFRLLLRERSGTSEAFRAAVAREIDHFTAELAAYLHHKTKGEQEVMDALANAFVTLVFSAGADALDMKPEQRATLARKVILQLRMISRGSEQYFKPKQKNP